MNSRQHPTRAPAGQRPVPWCTIVMLASIFSGASIVLFWPLATESMCELAAHAPNTSNLSESVQ